MGKSEKMLSVFMDKLEANKIQVGIIGLGYVGLPLAEAYCRRGIKVVGYDIKKKRVDVLNSGKSGMRHIEDERVAAMIDKGFFKATTDAKMLGEVDAIMICVPTPLDQYHHPDLSYVEKTCEALAKHLRVGQLIVLESTTYPGTTEEVMKPILEKSGLKAGVDFALAYSPEREDPGNIDFETSTIPKLVGADSEHERAMSKAIYDRIVETIIVPNTRTAEAAKLTENIFRWVNIAMVNELKLIYDKMGIDVWEVIDAAKSKPFGYMPFYPGPGVGGHCIRIDPYYLTWKAREHGMSTRFIELAGEININMPAHVVSRLMEQLNLRHKKALGGCKVLLLGLAYKKDIDDLRESPSMKIYEELIKQGATVDYYDPFISEVPHVHEYSQFEGHKSVEFDLKAFKKYDAAVIATNHSFVDYAGIVDAIPLTVDSRNVTNDLSEALQKKVEKV